MEKLYDCSNVTQNCYLQTSNWYTKEKRADLNNLANNLTSIKKKVQKVWENSNSK